MIAIPLFVAIVLAGLIFLGTKSIFTKPIAKIYGFLFLIISATGLWLFVDYWNVVTDFQKLKSWPTTEAKIISSVVMGKRAFHPEIVYEFTVGEKTIRDTTDMEVPGFGTKANRLLVAEYNVEKFSTGKTMIIYYDPANPESSFLKPHASYTIYLLLSCGWVVFGIGAYFLIVTGYSNRK